MNKLFIFGATGDLAKRKLFPAVFNLMTKNSAKFDLENFDLEIVAVSRRNWNNQQFQNYLNQEIMMADNKKNTILWQDFLHNIRYIQHDLTADNYHEFSSKISSLVETRKKISGKEVKNCYFYLAIPPKNSQMFIDKFVDSDFYANHKKKIRLLFEKPFGTSLDSAQKLNQTLDRYFSFDQIYRVDHVVNRDLLLELTEFRQYNFLFAKLFNNQFIDSIQINYTETLGMEGRGAFYDQVGALKDMVQSHLLEVLSLILVASESFRDPDELKQARTLMVSQLEIGSAKDVVFGRYADGKINGSEVASYLNEPDVDKNSSTETFVAMKLTSSDTRWQGVPIYLKTGKRLNKKALEIHLYFKKVQNTKSQNILSFRVHPGTGININILDLDQNTKSLRNRDLTYCFRQYELEDAYQNLFDNLFAGNTKSLLSSQEIYENWKLVEDVQKYKQPDKLVEYEAGTKGPVQADALLAADGNSWFDRNILENCKS